MDGRVVCVYVAKCRFSFSWYFLTGAMVNRGNPLLQSSSLPIFPSPHSPLSTVLITGTEYDPQRVFRELVGCYVSHEDFQSSRRCTYRAARTMADAVADAVATADVHDTHHARAANGGANGGASGGANGEAPLFKHAHE